MTTDTYLKSAAKLNTTYIDDPKRKVSGVLKNLDSVAISRMKVTIENISTFTTTDIHGHFEISIPDTLKGIISIHFSGIGYGDKYIHVNTDKLPVDLGEIYMGPEIIRSENFVNSIAGKAGGMVAYPVKRRKWWQVWRKKHEI